MAYPYLLDATFDAGTIDSFSTEVDSSSILDYPHYKELAKGGFAPWAGGHCCRVRLNGTAVASLEATSALDLSADGNIAIWFPLLIGADLSLTASDTVILFSLVSTGPVNELVMGIRNNAGTYELFAGETGATRTLAIVPNNKRWYQIEIVANIDAGGGNDGTLNFYVDGAPIGAQITGLDQAAITEGFIGAISGTGTGNRGTILIGGFIADDVRVYPRTRFATDKWVTHDVTAFIGHGFIDAASISGTSTDAVLAVYDTDIFESTGIGFSRQPLVYIRNITANDQSPGMTTPVEFTKGCYCVLTGTNPQAFLSIKDCPGTGIVQSNANYIDAGMARKGLI